jgi:hypothetical protein
MTLTLDDLRSVAAWAAGCSERVLSLFEAKVPSDRRPRDAIEAIREFAHGGKRTARLRSLALAAHAAARQVNDPAATASARAAGIAAASAYTHPLATIDQAKHILGSPVYAALARELAADEEAAAHEIRWAIKNASTKVCEVLRRFPVRSEGRTRLDAIYYQLDDGLRSGSARKLRVVR